MIGTTAESTLVDVNLIINKARIGENMKVADLGCGANCYYLFPLAKAVGNKGMVYAIDILKNALNAVKYKAKEAGFLNIKIIWSNLEVFGATKIPSNSLGAALIANMLHQSHKRAEILREALRMIKKDGKLIVVGWRNIDSPLGPPVEDRVDSDALIKAGPKLGIKLEDEFFPGPYHYALIFSKL